MDSFFDTSWTYESGAMNYASLSKEDKPLFILGNSFNAAIDHGLVVSICRSFLWVTYRKNLPSVADSFTLTTDQGWGCMHRSGQMLLANLFLRILNNGRMPLNSSENNSLGFSFADVLRMFVDFPNSVFSIQAISSEAKSLFDKKPGEWLGPNAVCQALKQLFELGDRPLVSDLFLHVCRDGILIIDEVLSVMSDSSCNKKLFLMISLRLGLADINPLYITSLLRAMRVKQFAGLLGGKPNHASWFFGTFGDDELLCLDPHTTQVFIDPINADEYSSYHCPYVTRIPVANLDPSLALTFYCDSNDSFLELCTDLKTIFLQTAALFDIVQEMPAAVSSSMADWPLTSSEESDNENVGKDFEVI